MVVEGNREEKETLVGHILRRDCLQWKREGEEEYVRRGRNYQDMEEDAPGPRRY